MPKKTETTTSSKRSHVAFDMGSLEPAAIRGNEVGLETAICILEDHFHNTTADLEDLLNDLLSTVGRFEFVFSVITTDAAHLLVHKIIGTFPESAGLFEGSLACILLSGLGSYFQGLEYPAANLQEYHHSTELARGALKAVANMFVPARQNVDRDLDGSVRKRANQQDRKQNRQALQPTPLTGRAEPFELVGIDVPTTWEDAESISSQLLLNQKNVLKYYFRVLRRDDLVDKIRSVYLQEQDEDTEPSTGQDAHLEVQPASNMSAYPFIQPMKAALYFESVEGFGDWRLLICSRADRNLRTAKKRNPKMFDIIMKKLKELSNGHFSDDNHKYLTGAGTDIPILEAKMTGDTRLVYHVDCVQDFETELVQQVLVIRGVYTHAQIDQRLWNVLSQSLGAKGKTYRQRCIYRTEPKNRGDKVFSPQTWPSSPEPISMAAGVDVHALSEKDKQELHALLALEKFIPFSQAVLKSILADEDVAHVFQMAPAEQKIVKHASSCYVLGRSGTGKTTTMMFKMLGIQLAYDKLIKEGHADISPPRQLFVTQSRVLAEKVEEYYGRLAAAYSAGLRSAVKSVKTTENNEAQQEEDLVDQEEEELWHNTLPSAFKDLKDEHFPLFLTYDQFCRLLEGDYDQLSGVDPIDAADSHVVASDYMLQQRRSFVSYPVFQKDYWMHLPQHLTKNLDPALVFAEFIGVIRGSEQSLESEHGCLDEDQYINLTHRQSTFSSLRRTIYALFQAYIKLKRTRREWDAADRTHAILRELSTHGVLGQKLDFIYVDEAQDNLLIDASVLRQTCRNPNGLFWAGDTAQTISAGSSFRFDDLKAYMYRLEARNAESSDVPTFQLTTNYRSHGGIVKAAHFIVKLITRCWPKTIDTLAEEMGVVDGEKPIFFTNWDQQTAQYEQFLFGSAGSQIEFGADQCIIVRDDAARDRLRAQVGDIGTVLTLYESKGLEFNDVLIYNFFEDSSIDVAQWRVVLNALPEDIQVKCPKLDDIKHAGVCRELKFLYVAITRARKNLWIADDSDKGEPMRDLWSAFSLIRSLSLADVPQLTRVSKPEEWEATGRMLFKARRYAQAARCFDRALNTRQAQIASAYASRQNAENISANDRSGTVARKAAFLYAADAFIAIASSSKQHTRRLAHYRIAAQCYRDAGDEDTAARTWILAEQFDIAAQIFRKLGSFDDAIRVIDQHEKSMKLEVITGIRDVAKIHYLKSERLRNAIKLFDTLDEALDFAEDLGFTAARIALLVGAGRFVEAAAIHLEEGRTSQAIRTLMQDWSNPESRRSAERFISQGLWDHLSFGITPHSGEEDYSLLQELLSLAMTLEEQGDLTPSCLDELYMFRAVTDNNVTVLRELGRRFIQQGPPETAAGLLCLDHVFKNPLELHQATALELDAMLRDFLLYCREMQRIGHSPNAEDASLQRLFGFHTLQEADNAFHLRANIFIHSYHTQSSRSTSSGGPCILSQAGLRRLLGEALCERLRLRVQSENYLCARALSLNPCAVWAVYQACNSPRCQRNHDERAITNRSAQLMMRIVLQQIQIYQTIAFDEPWIEAFHKKRQWLSRLYHILFPEYYKSGGLCEINFSAILDTVKWKYVVMDWIGDVLSVLSETYEREHFLSHVVELVELAEMLDPTSSKKFIYRAPCIARARGTIYLRGQDEVYIIHDVVEYVHGQSEDATTRGILLLQAVLDKQISLDVNILCNLFEGICASVIVAHRLQQYGSLHNMTLTRKWIHILHSKMTALRMRQPELLALLRVTILPLVPDLLREMSSGDQGMLYYLGKPRFDNKIRNICIARICKSLALLGYNINNLKLKWDIARILGSWASKEMPYSFVFREYIQAGTPDGVVRALRSTGRREASTWGELVQLKETAKSENYTLPIRGVRFIFYKKEEEIPLLLKGNTPSSHPQLDSSEIVPSVAATSDLEDPVFQEQEIEMDTMPNDEDDVVIIDENIDLTAIMRNTDREREEVKPPTKQEIEAARIIMRVCRRALRRKGPQHGPDDALSRHYIAYLQQASDTMHYKYKIRFLGLLPHVLVCIDHIISKILTAKKDLRGRTKRLRHQEYDNVIKQLNDLNAIKKKAHDFKNILSPRSNSHEASYSTDAQKQTQCLIDLRQVVAELQQWVEGLPKHYIEGVHADLLVAVAGKFKNPQVPRKAPKPKLVLDDDEYWGF